MVDLFFVLAVGAVVAIGGYSAVRERYLAHRHSSDVLKQRMEALAQDAQQTITHHEDILQSLAQRVAVHANHQTAAGEILDRLTGPRS